MSSSKINWPLGKYTGYGNYSSSENVFSCLKTFIQLMGQSYVRIEFRLRSGDGNLAAPYSAMMIGSPLLESS